MSRGKPVLLYTPPASREGAEPLHLVAVGADGRVERFPFYDRIELGRFHSSRVPLPEQLLIEDRTVSSRHCLVAQRNGNCYVQDFSRNGTRINGRRLTPNLEMNYEAGQVIQVGTFFTFTIEGAQDLVEFEEPTSGTFVATNTTLVTVLVGDIRDYSQLIQQKDQATVSNSVTRLFESLEQKIWKLGGTVKEFQGDAVVAYWETGEGGNHAHAACHAVLALRDYLQEAAQDPSIWSMTDFPLHMDWALATGDVVVNAFSKVGGSGMAMLGTPLVLAFRLEKLANNETGGILASETTQELTRKLMQYRDLGEHEVKGFGPQRVYELLGPLP